jgi:DNA repair protein RadC
MKKAAQTPLFDKSAGLPEFKISFKSNRPAQSKIVKCSKDVADVCRIVFDADTIDWVESFIVIGLSRSNSVIGFYKISQGGVTGTVADIRVILQFALLSNSEYLILCHNHPSGNLTPSRADEELTQKIKQAASYFYIKVLDHIIITSESYFSFADQGIL